MKITIGSLVKKKMGRVRVIRRRANRESWNSMLALKRESPVSFRKEPAFHCSSKGKKVSGRKNNAMRNTKPDIISVTQSTQRHVKESDCISHPPTIGAITGPVFVSAT